MTVSGHIGEGVTCTNAIFPRARHIIPKSMATFRPSNPKADKMQTTARPQSISAHVFENLGQIEAQMLAGVYQLSICAQMTTVLGKEVNLSNFRKALHSARKKKAGLSSAQGNAETPPARLNRSFSGVGTGQNGDEINGRKLDKDELAALQNDHHGHGQHSPQAPDKPQAPTFGKFLSEQERGEVIEFVEQLLARRTNVTG